MSLSLHSPSVVAKARQLGCTPLEALYLSRYSPRSPALLLVTKKKDYRP